MGSDLQARRQAPHDVRRKLPELIPKPAVEDRLQDGSQQLRIAVEIDLPLPDVPCPDSYRSHASDSIAHGAGVRISGRGAGWPDSVPRQVLDFAGLAVGRRLALPEGMRRIAALAIALLSPAATALAGPGPDTLILREGGFFRGSLASCDDVTCLFNGNEVSRSRIAMIGLAAGAPLPVPVDPMRDEIHFADGRMEPGPLVSVDAKQVVTKTRAFPRKSVRWIWLGVDGARPRRRSPARTTNTEEAVTGAWLWEGKIRVRNHRAEDKFGLHDWIATYRVSLVEWNGALELAGDFRYEIEVKEHEHRVVWTSRPAETFIYRGDASGVFRGDDKPAEVGGIISPLDGVLPPRHSPGTFDSYNAAAEWGQEEHNRGDPGWYMLAGGLERDAQRSIAERRAWYEGIEISGTLFDRPDFDPTDEMLVTNVPPLAFWLRGRLDRGDQKVVRGTTSYPEAGNITMSVEWDFTRRPVAAPEE